MTYARRMPVLALILFLGGTSGPAIAQGRVVVEIDKVQVVHAISGVVRDPSGTLVSAATVSEISPDGKTVIQSATTDQGGALSLFHLLRKGLRSEDFIRQISGLQSPNRAPESQQVDEEIAKSQT